MQILVMQQSHWLAFGGESKGAAREILSRSFCFPCRYLRRPCVPALPSFNFPVGSAACLLLGAPQNFSWPSLRCCWCCQRLKPWMQEIRLPSCWASLSASLDSVPASACMPGKEMDSNDVKKMLKWSVFPNTAWDWGLGLNTVFQFWIAF